LLEIRERDALKLRSRQMLQYSCTTKGFAAQELSVVSAVVSGVDAIRRTDQIMGAVKLVVALGLLAVFFGCATPVQYPPAPTLEEIVSMSKAGTPPDEIIRKMQVAHAVYPLSAAELAKLHDQGVNDNVINYMQQTYLEQMRRETYYRYYDPWWPYWGYYPYPYWRGYPWWP
jgi:hypothetical protein